MMEEILNSKIIFVNFSFPAFFEPTDMRKAMVPFELPKHLTKQIKFISPNIHELNAIAKCLHYAYDYPITSLDNNFSDEKFFNDLQKITAFVNETIENVIVTLGPIGIMIARKNDSLSAMYDRRGRYMSEAKSNKSQLRLYETKKIENIVNVSGAGDSFASGFIVSMIQGLAENVCVSVGFEASKCALMSSSPVPSKYFDSNHSCWLNGAVSMNF